MELSPFRSEGYCSFLAAKLICSPAQVLIFHEYGLSLLDQPFYASSRLIGRPLWDLVVENLQRLDWQFALFVTFE